MRKTLVILIILLSFSCSSTEWNDYSSMNLNGKIELIIEKGYDNDGSLKVTKKYYFNNSGFIDSTVFIFGSSVFKTEIIYRKNRISKQIISYGKESFEQEYLHVENKFDSLINKSPDGTVTAVGNIYYNENMKPIKTVSFSPQGDTLYIEKTLYDNQGNMFELHFDSKDSSVGYSSINKFFYDSDGNVNRFSVLKNGQLETDETYQYEFDDKNNWIIKTVIDSNGELRKTEKREITYK